MHKNDDQLPSPVRAANGFIGLVVCLAQLWTRPLQLLTTRPGTMGRRYLAGAHMGFGLMLFPFAMAFLIPFLGLPPGQDGFGGVILFWLVMIFARLVHAVRGAALRKSGYSVHSLYWGKAILPALFTDDAAKHKCRQDALLMMAWGISVGLLTTSVPVIAYGMIGMLLSVIPVMYADMQDDARIEAAEDARHDAEWLASELKKRRSNRWN